MSTKKIVITGASGFLGRNLVDTLKDNEGVFIYALSSKAMELKCENNNRNIEYCHKDLVFHDSGERILKGAIVVNCAFPRNHNGTEIADGLRYIQQLFLRSKECGAKAIINISSQSVYSQTREEAATENTSLCIDNAYGVGKYATELLLESICKGSKTAYTNIRMASLIGPGFDQRIINRLIKKALISGTIEIYDNNQIFGFLDIEDAVSALCLMLKSNEQIWDNVYNLGNNNASYSLLSIAELIKEKFEDIFSKSIDIRTTVDDSSSCTSIDSTKFMLDFQFHPTISLEESIVKIIVDLSDDCM